MELMIMILEGQFGVGGYCEYDILIVIEDGVDNIIGFFFGLEYNIILK